MLVCGRDDHDTRGSQNVAYHMATVHRPWPLTFSWRHPQTKVNHPAVLISLGQWDRYFNILKFDSCDLDLWLWPSIGVILSLWSITLPCQKTIHLSICQFSWYYVHMNYGHSGFHDLELWPFNKRLPQTMFCHPVKYDKDDSLDDLAVIVETWIFDIWLMWPWPFICIILSSWSITMSSMKMIC